MSKSLVRHSSRSLVSRLSRTRPLTGWPLQPVTLDLDGWFYEVRKDDSELKEDII